MYEQYDDEEIGALDEDDIAGCVPQNSDLLNNALDEFEEQMKRVELLQSQTSVSPVQIDISTPQISIADLDKPGVSKQIQTIFAKMPPLPTFSGVVPVPKGEGSYK